MSGRPPLDALASPPDTRRVANDDGQTAAPGPRPTSSRPGPAATRGLRVAQLIYFSLLVWIIVAGSAEILRDSLFRGAPARDAATCRVELSVLRARLADATLAVDDVVAGSELAAVATYRAALGGPGGRAFDQRVYELVDGCPPAESQAAYALARLRAAHEAMIRLDALEAAPARLAHKKALTPAILAAPGSLPSPPGSSQKAP